MISTPKILLLSQILKGAKAAVLYGSEGANGVMLITTKSGSKKGLGIDFGVNHSWNVAAYLPKMQNIYGAGSSPGNAGVKEVDKDGFWTMTDPNTGQTVSQSGVVVTVASVREWTVVCCWIGTDSIIPTRLTKITSAICIAPVDRPT